MDQSSAILSPPAADDSRGADSSPFCSVGLCKQTSCCAARPHDLANTINDVSPSVAPPPQILAAQFPDGQAKGGATRQRRPLSPKKLGFLAAFAASDGNVSAAARAVNVHRSRPYRWLAQDRAFAEALAAGREQACEHAIQQMLGRLTEEGNVKRGGYARRAHGGAPHSITQPPADAGKEIKC